MTLSRLPGLGLPLATTLAYGVLVLGYGPQLQAEASGLPPLDLRAQGYGQAEVRHYLEMLSPEGVAIYLGPVRWLDTAFALLMGLTFVWWMRPLTGLIGSFGVMAAVACAALDLAENAVVATILRAGADGVAPGQIALASMLTQLKFAAYALAAVLTALAVWRRQRVRA